MGYLERRTYDAGGLQNAYGGYEEAVRAVIVDKTQASRQLLNMAKALEVCTRVRKDDASVDFFKTRQIDYLNQMDVPINKNLQ